MLFVSSDIFEDESIEDDKNEDNSNESENDNTAFFPGGFLHPNFCYVYLFFGQFYGLVRSFYLVLNYLDLVALFFDQHSDDLQKVQTLFNRRLQFENLVRFLHNVLEGVLNTDAFPFQFIPSQSLRLFLFSFLFNFLVHFQVDSHLFFYRLD